MGSEQITIGSENLLNDFKGEDICIMFMVQQYKCLLHQERCPPFQT